MSQHKGISLHQNVLSGDAFFLRQLHFIEDKDLIQRNVRLMVEPPGLAKMIELWRDRGTLSSWSSRVGHWLPLATRLWNKKLLIPPLNYSPAMLSNQHYQTMTKVCEKVYPSQDKQGPTV